VIYALLLIPYSFSEHSNSIVAKVHMRASQILRCFFSRAFNAYMCSAPGRVQRWFAKRVKSVSNLSYDERLLKLEIERLELRTDLLMSYKTLHHFVDMPKTAYSLIVMSK